MSKTDCTTYCIYRITCFRTALTYVGQTNDSDKRRRNHFSLLRRGKHCNPYLQRSWNKYGEDAFFYEVLETGITEDRVDEREIYWIEQFNSFKAGFNNAPGGRHGPGMQNSIGCCWNGIEYSSQSAAARALGISQTTLWDRLSRGYTSDKDMKQVHEVICTWNGKNYSSVTEAAKTIGITKASMWARLKRGYICDTDMIKRRK